MSDKLKSYVHHFPKKQRSNIAYPVSKTFVIWYSKHIAAELGTREAHIVSVSPGSFSTPMGEKESDNGAAALTQLGAIKRFGRPEEIASVLAYLAEKSPVYLTATDIAVDGGDSGLMTKKDMANMAK